MVTQSWKHRQVGEVPSNGLGHVGEHVNHHLCGELARRYMWWTVAVTAEMRNKIHDSLVIDYKYTKQFCNKLF